MDAKRTKEMLGFISKKRELCKRIFELELAIPSNWNNWTEELELEYLLLKPTLRQVENRLSCLIENETRV